MINLGSDHTLRFTIWSPDDLPENRAKYNIPSNQPMPLVEKFGAIISHPNLKDPTKICEGSITFDGEWQRKVTKNDFWTIESLDPLTLSPSILCVCGDHGYIRQGRWINA